MARKFRDERTIPSSFYDTPRVDTSGEHAVPSFEHELPIRILQDAPPVLRALLRRVLPDVEFPPDAPIVRRDTEFTEIAPSSYRADGVFTIGEPVEHAVVLEVQRRIDPDKPYAWMRYLSGLLSEHKVRVDVVVITPDPAVAQWARTRVPITSSVSWAPVVIEPSMLLVESNVELLLEHPELAVLWIQLAKGLYEVPDEVFLNTSRWLAEEAELAEETEKLYRDVIRYAAPAAILELVRTQMGVAEERYESEFFRSLYRDAHNEGLEQGLQAGREQGLQAGREQGLQAGREQGLQAGREQGEAHAMKQALRGVLKARSFVLKPEHDARIDSCVDTTQLEQWVQSAATANSVADVFR